MSGRSASGRTVESVDIDRLVELMADLEDLAHDLGKYIGLQTGFCGLDAPDEELREALRADLRSTRRRGAQVWTAWELWDELRPGELADDPAVQQLDRALSALARCDLDGDRASLLEVAAMTRGVRRCCRDLVARARARLDAAGRLQALW